MTNKQRLEEVLKKIEVLEEKILKIEQDHYIFINKFKAPDGTPLREHLDNEKKEIERLKRIQDAAS